jgi:hypothetical protein
LIEDSTLHAKAVSTRGYYMYETHLQRLQSHWRSTSSASSISDFFSSSYMAAHMIEVEPRLNLVSLNVGGTMFSTTLKTLRSRPGSIISQMFQGRVMASAPKDETGAYFIDRYASKK